MNTPAYLLRKEAIRKYEIDENALRAAVQRGLVRAIKVNGHIAVAEEDVRKLCDANGEPVAELPQYIPLAEALCRFQISEEALEEAISFGRIRTTTIGEEVAVAEQDVRELAKGQEVMVVRRETFKHLLVARCKHVVVFAKGAAVANVVTTNFIVANRTPKRWHEWYKKCGSLW